MKTCKDCYRRNPATGYCPVRTYEVEENHETCGSYATPPRDMNEPKEEATKTCKRCGKELPLSSFSRNRNGLLGVCKDCMKAAQKKGAKKTKTILDDPKIQEAVKKPSEVAEFVLDQIIPPVKVYDSDSFAKDCKEMSDRMLFAYAKEIVTELRLRGYEIECHIVHRETL